MDAKPLWSRLGIGQARIRNEASNGLEFARWEFAGLGGPIQSKTCNALGIVPCALFKHGLNGSLGVLACGRCPKSRILPGRHDSGVRIRCLHASLKRRPTCARAGACRP